MDKFGTKRHALMVSFALVVVSLIVWWPVKLNAFLNYDDPDYITSNPFVLPGFTLSGLFQAFKFHAANWHPLTWMSHMLDVTLFGQDAGWHHLVSAAIHTANGVLVFLVLRAMTGAFWRAAFVAALFLLHPLRVESVAWASERKDVLSGFFWLLTMWAYSAYSRERTRRRMALVCAVYVLGLMAKPMVVTLPFALLLLDFWPLRRIALPPVHEKPAWPAWRGALVPLVLEKMPLFILSALACVVTLFAQKSGGAIQSLEKIPVDLRVGNAIQSVIRYVGKILWPADLSVHYPMPDIISWPPVLGALVLVAAISFMAARWVDRRPWIAFGWLWFLGTLFPVIGLVQVGSQAFADRYTYLPSLGFFVAVVWSAAEVTCNLPRRAWLRMGCAAAVLAACVAATRDTIPHWRTSEALFTQALPNNVRNVVIHISLGNALEDEGKYDEAISHYVEALKIRPRYAEAHYNWGNILMHQQQFSEAIKHFESAIQFNPGHINARINLANALVEVGRGEEALAQLEALVKSHPDEYRAHNNLGNALALRGRWNEAVAHFQQALELRPGNAETLNNWAAALADQGKTTEAARLYREALKNNPADARAHNELGRLDAELNQPAEAVKQYTEALRLNPSFVEAHLNYGMALTLTRQFDEAVKHFNEALRLRPNSAEAHNNLAYILTEQGKVSEAIPHYLEAVRLKPTLAPAFNSLARIYATNPDAKLRNGGEAVKLAERACELSRRQQVLFLDTLAAAYAEAGRFPEAVATARETVELATRMGQTGFAAQVQERIQRYQTGQPWRGP